MAHWEFLPNPGREEEGLGHAGIETFKGSPYPGIARECSQNSLDAAARHPDGTPEPVHLVFRLLSVPASEIPGLGALKNALQACLDQAEARRLKKDKDFFQRALRVAEAAHIPVLSIEDYGTTGLLGPAVEGKPFHALVKSSGVSQKPDADAGGSFGIGKNAAFAISTLRTVFYSTHYLQNSEPMRLAQGKAILVSHDGGTEPKRSTGYWGNAAYMPVEDTAALPAWLQRSAVGTTVTSIGFSEEPEWYWLMTESLIRNFFSAINTGAIRFTVHWSDHDSLEIDSSSLEDLFVRQEVRNAAENSGTTEDLEFSAAMLTALKSPDSEITTETFDGLGTFRMTLLQKEGFPRRVGILRNGMYIADNLRHFGHAMARFPMSRDFVVILEPNDRTTSGQVREMESPRHDEISAERLDDLAQRKKLKAAVKKVGDWIRNTIRSATTKPAEAEILLDEMNRFFSKPGAAQSIPDPANQNDDPEKSKITPDPAKPVPLLGSGNAGESGSSGGLKKSKTKGGKTSGVRTGKGRGAIGGRGGKSVAFSSLRNSVVGDGKVRRISFTPDESATASLEINAIGVSTDELLDIRSIDGQPCPKSPKVELKAGERLSLEVAFDSPYVGPISLVLSSIPGGEHAN
jgi:hypothetical protein